MIDIISLPDGLDLGIFDTLTSKGKNILSVQQGSLEYAPSLGIDLEFFIFGEFRFQNETFKAYLVEVLANNGVNISSLDDTVADLFHKYTFNLQPDDTNAGLIAR